MHDLRLSWPAGAKITAANAATASGGAATLDAVAGVITTDALTTAAGAEATLTLTNACVGANDAVLVTLANGTNSAGAPVIRTATPAAGAVTIVIRNVHASAALNGTLRVGFLVLKA